MITKFTIFIFLLGDLFAAGDVALSGQDLSLFWFLPFLGILFSIAILPLISPYFWHKNYGKVSFFWLLIFTIFFFLTFGYNTASFYFIEVIVGEFIPFVVLLLSLFVVTGGICIRGTFKPTPLNNLKLMVLGTSIASWMGTTGAAMLLVRPLINANYIRKFNVHIFVFFIFLVANIGGSLTPLGDPPLFLGFLKGISFFWPTVNLFLPMLVASIILLIVFYVLDIYYYKKEPFSVKKTSPNERLSIIGYKNFIYLVMIVMTVVVSGLWNADRQIESNWAISLKGHCILTKGGLFQIISLSIISIISYKSTSKEILDLNAFNWEPILEVSKLFITIFITMIPIIAILKAGNEGSLGFIVSLVREGDVFYDRMFFWITGILSGFLDNAPTYLVFLNTALSKFQDTSLGLDMLMSTYKSTLKAISLGAVFFGALTYIGNAPNFMIQSIVEHRQIKMPSFFGYLKWSIIILLPTFLIITVIFF